MRTRVLWILWLLMAGSLRAETIDRVLAVVGGELISLTDVTAARDLGRVTPGNVPDPIGAVLSTLIDRQLILAEVDRYAPPEPSAAAVDRDLQAARAKFPSLPAYEAALARSGIDEKHLRETVREDLRIQAYLDQRFTVTPPTEEELGRYYRERAQAFTRNGQLVPFELARVDVRESLTAERRKPLIDDWVAGLHRRADLIDLYLSGR